LQEARSFGVHKSYILQDAGRNFGQHKSLLARCKKRQEATAYFHKQYFMDGGAV
jgi:hypothetical protein